MVLTLPRDKLKNTTRFDSRAEYSYYANLIYVFSQCLLDDLDATRQFKNIE